ncbi:hypothetical protein HK100_002812 [Physocladia obscura]|uniref:Chromate transporter n=1 Tax=Physocladia obscura TaxID=109957 RepID=A0AAD5T8K5_9FUNG|nr:hypothetical protein HK100_002812 [Physocladia obscura]
MTVPFADRIIDVAITFLPLPFITFGGPQAHIALLLDLFVTKKQWLSEEMFAELYAISNALPGPASTQLSFTIALIRSGVVAGVLAFVICCLPGGIVMGALGYAVGRLGASEIPLYVLYIERALASVSIALITLAAKQLSTKLILDKISATLAAVTVALVINFSSQAWLIPVIMICGGIITYVEGITPGIVEKYKAKQSKQNSNHSGNADEASSDPLVVEISVVEPVNSVLPISDNSVGINNVERSSSHAVGNSSNLQIYFSYSVKTGAFLIFLFVLLIIISVIFRVQPVPLALKIFFTFYFVGAIIFGGGPVVVPLLYNYVVSNTVWLTPTEFLMGFAVINVMPGPNFNFAAYCGALAYRATGATSFTGALMAWAGIFLPGLLIKAGILPIWRNYRDMTVLRTVFKGLNSVAVGLLVSAVYILWMKAIVLPDNNVSSLGEYTGWTALMVVAFLIMDTWKVAPWFVVGGSTVVGVLVWIADGKPL